MLREFYRPHFHRGRVENIPDLNRALQTWLTDYNTARPNQGDFMQGRTPRQVRIALRRRLRQTPA